MIRARLSHSVPSEAGLEYVNTPFFIPRNFFETESSFFSHGRDWGVTLCLVRTTSVVKRANCATSVCKAVNPPSVSLGGGDLKEATIP